jgi:hypothetical protein
MSIQYYLFLISNKAFKLIYFIDSYIPFINILKKIYRYFKNKDELKKNYCNKIQITDIYYIKNNDYSNKKLIVGLNHNINNFWEKYQEEFKDKPNINDIIQVNYTVPFKDSNNLYTHKPFIITYAYPSKIVFPPYTLEEIKNRDKKEILFASSGDDDVTEDVVKISGPLGNFYLDLQEGQNIKITKNILDLPGNLLITDEMGVEYDFKNDEIIFLEEIM